MQIVANVTIRCSLVRAKRSPNILVHKLKDTEKQLFFNKEKEKVASKLNECKKFPTVIQNKQQKHTSNVHREGGGGGYMLLLPY